MTILLLGYFARYLANLATKNDLGGFTTTRDKDYLHRYSKRERREDERGINSASRKLNIILRLSDERWELV